MELDEFAARAREFFEEIPPEFRERVQGPVVLPEAKGHRRVRGMLTLGECVHAPGFSADEPLHSTIFLYHGSFAACARRDPSFDVEGELRETVRHEVQHHVEDLAGHRRLRDYDWASEQNALRKEGRPHAASFWRGGEPVKEDRDLRMLDGDLFLELSLSSDEWERARREGVVLTVAGEELEIPAQEIEHDEEIFEFEGPFDAESAFHHEPADGDLVVVVRRRPSLLPRPRARARN